MKTLNQKDFKMNATNFTSYVSQKNWKDEDEKVECYLECVVDGQKYKKFVMATDPLEAIHMTQKDFDISEWQKVT